MCGIAGYSGAGDEKVLSRMNDTLAHRGPNDAGVQVFPQGKDRSVGLAHRRLSIIDLTPTGHQPLSNKDGTVSIVFNGEIYNYRELRGTLTNEYAFKGGSDTEVIVHLYEKYGTEAFKKLEGMFALALYDTKRDLLFLVRDRMGKKPLYYSVQKDTLLFGSELKALIEHPLFKKELDYSSLNKYLLYEYVPTPHSMFMGTYKLEPGTILTWDGREVQKEQFWKPTFVPKVASFTESLEQFDRLLEESVRKRLVADVPVGILLSGGIDSSTIAYYATKVHSENVKTFAIGFDEPTFDESGYARTVAEHLGTEHHEHTVSVRDCIGLVSEIGDLSDEPVADSSLVPTYFLSQFTREHVTVALGGDGGDELLCGYDPFIAHRLGALYAGAPAALRSLIARMALKLPVSHRNISLDFKIKKFTSGFARDHRYRNQRWLGAFDDEERGLLLTDEVRQSLGDAYVFEDIDRYLSEMDSHDKYDELSYLYQRMYMMDGILVKVDRTSMRHALEVRAPFLDTSVVDLANHMPTSYKFHGLTRKYILKKLMEDRLPHDIVYRKKKGFGMPIGSWLRGDLKPLMMDLLSKESLDRTGLFNASYVERLMHEHLEGTHDHRKLLWTLLVFVLWYRRWVG